MRKIDRIFLVSEVLDAAFDGPVSHKDLLSLADVIVSSDQSGFIEEYDRPLNFSNPNFYSQPVDVALANQGFVIAAKEQAGLTDSSEIRSYCPKKRYDEFCKLVA